ncbi:MAG: hypothetical protein IIB38_09590 [Candidatus Hydrogenedentes bacterium]|nr:hypothetical protein [Candidatus Hydrogenedentota bacterium]
MKAKFNPTGTHVHKGSLKVRIDLYPGIGDKTYEIHHVQVPVIPPEGYQGEVDKEGSPVDQNDYNNWIDGLPKIWQLNPALCHFIKIDQDTTLASLDGIVRGIFNKATLDQLDDILSKLDTSQVSRIMKSKLGSGKVVSKFTDEDRDKLNTRFASLEIAV